MVNTISPDAGAYVPFVGINCLTNCSPTRGSAIPTTSVGRYPLPPETSFTFVTLPLVTVISAVAPTPLPSRFLSETAENTPSLYPVPGVNSFGSSLDIPTLTVIVSPATAV